MNKTKRRISVKMVCFITAIFTFIAMFFSTILWIGSYEQFEQMRNESILALFINRFIVNLIVIFIGLILNWLALRIIFNDRESKKSFKKNILIEGLVLVGISVVMIVIRIL